MNRDFDNNIKENNILPDIVTVKIEEVAVCILVDILVFQIINKLTVSIVVPSVKLSWFETGIKKENY